MRFWHDFLDSLDSDGGKIAILLFLILAGGVFTHFQVPKAEDITAGAFGALLLALKDAGSNKDRREGAPLPLPTTAGAPSVLPVMPAPAWGGPSDVVAVIEKKGETL